MKANVTETTTMLDSVWVRLAQRFGLVSSRPRLAADVRQRKKGGEPVLERTSTGYQIEVSADDLKLLRRFDGKTSVAEVVLSPTGESEGLRPETVIELVERLSRAGMLAETQTNIYRRIERSLAQQAAVRARSSAVERPSEEVAETLSSNTQPTWRPRNQMFAERAEFLRTIEALRDVDSEGLGLLADIAAEEAFPASSVIPYGGHDRQIVRVIRTGEANVLRKDVHGHPQRVARLRPAELFGVTPLAVQLGEAVSIRSEPSRPVVTYSWDADAFARVVGPYIPAVREFNRLRERVERLSEFPIMESLDPGALESIAAALKEVHLKAGETVFKQGDPATTFYMVAEGEVQVVRDEQPVAVLPAGAFFGETALLFSNDRNATVVAHSDVTLWELEQATFQQLAMLRRRDLMPLILNRLHGGEAN